MANKNSISVTMRHFIIQMLAMLVVVVIANIGLRQYCLYRNYNSNAFLARLSSSKQASHLFLGNSTMEAAFNESVFKNVVPDSVPLDMSIAATFPVEHYTTYKSYDQHQSAILFYGFFDTQLTDSNSATWNEIVGNRRIVFYTDLDAAMRLYAPDSSFQSIMLQIAGKVPFLFERKTVWNKVRLWRSSGAGLGMARKQFNEFGAADDFDADETAIDAFRERCRNVVTREAQLSPAVSQIFNLANKQSDKFYVIEMPMTQKHRAMFNSGEIWARYHDHIHKLVQKAGGELVNASDWVQDEDFKDQLHVNSAGALSFTNRLAKWYQFRLEKKN